MAMGGEGGGVLADWIVDLAERSGYYAQSTSVPGVAQRTGATIYYIELFPEDAAQASRKDPVLALMPIPGELDIVLASELMEAARAVERGLVTPDRTTVIASTHRIYSMTEKIGMGDARVDPATLLEACTSAANVFVRQDFARLAEENRSVVSAVLVGALAGIGRLPIERAQFEDSIRKTGVGVESSLKAFAAGFNAASTKPVVTTAVSTPPAPIAQPKLGPQLHELSRRIETSFPLASHTILKLGIQRLADYQDPAYAAEYLDRLEPVRDRDAAVGDGCFHLLRETARYLALWMAYEDAIRVADLKIRRERFERVRLECRAAPGQIVEISEFLHPRVGEIADILPAGLGKWLLDTGWARGFVERLTSKGKTLRTTSLTGFLQLYGLASLRRFRPGSFRFSREQWRIREWLERIPALAAQDYSLALEVAECSRLIKGYGDTHTLGSGNFEAIIAVLPALGGRSDAAQIVRKLREAALADDTGQRLSEALQEMNA